ncbi:MAG: YHYH protein [Cyclobacteriaceae bacterium]
MRNITVIIILLFYSVSLSAHDEGHGTPLHSWQLKAVEGSFKADFIKYDQDEVWLMDPAHRVIKLSFADFSAEDQQYILKKHQMILAINREKKILNSWFTFSNPRIYFIISGFLLLTLSLFLSVKFKKRIHLIYGIAGIALLSLSCKDDDSTDDDSLTNDVPANDISFLKSVFESFEGVTTDTDDTYFYIASNGLPEHNMMVGITNWQQQVPIDMNYTGNNSWAIPIQPRLAEEPLSTSTNLLKGAIAIASNGIPIFNPLNNRGEDANAIGELDLWGGHCGRADDYHYHLPPTHLQSSVGEGKPIAYAVDGFPIYGETTEELDEYLGRFTDDGSYQYHSITEYPYLIAGMRGEVTLDPNTTAPENQVIPQATTRELRPALSPLRGAEIVAFESTGINSYSLTYTLNSENYKVNYSWDDNDLYTYEFVDPDGTTTTETYQR